MHIPVGPCRPAVRAGPPSPLKAGEPLPAIVVISPMVSLRYSSILYTTTSRCAAVA